MPRSNFGYVIATHLVKLVIIIQQQEFEPEDLLIQVNEDEVNAVEVQENQIADQNMGMQGPIIPPEFEVELPHLNHPLHNVLPEEVQEDEFMDVEEMQAENNVVEAQEDPLEPQNVQIGMVRIFNSQAVVPVSHWFDRNHNVSFMDHCGLWHKFFAPQSRACPSSLFLLIEHLSSRPSYSPTSF